MRAIDIEQMAAGMRCKGKQPRAAEHTAGGGQAAQMAAQSAT